MSRMQVLCSIGVIAAVVVTGCARRQKDAAIPLPPQPPPPAEAIAEPSVVPPAPPRPDNQIAVTPPKAISNPARKAAGGAWAAAPTACSPAKTRAPSTLTAARDSTAPV